MTTILRSLGRFIAAVVVVTLGTAGEWPAYESGVARQVSVLAAVGTWTNHPAATTELFGLTSRRVYADFTGTTQCRLNAGVLVASSAGAKAGIQASTDDGVTWVFFDGSANGDLGALLPQVGIATTGAKTSAYMSLHASLRTLVQLRAVGDDGDGAADPQILYIYPECK